MPTSEVSEQTLRMLPPWGIRRAAAWAQKKAPFRLVSTIRSHSASVTSSDAQGSSMPALLIRISIRDIDAQIDAHIRGHVHDGVALCGERGLCDAERLRIAAQ